MGKTVREFLYARPPNLKLIGIFSRSPLVNVKKNVDIARQHI